MDWEKELAKQMIMNESYNDEVCALVEKFWAHSINAQELIFHLNKLKDAAEGNHELFPVTIDYDYNGCGAI